jgi:hypothetical protein
MYYALYPQCRFVYCVSSKGDTNKNVSSDNGLLMTNNLVLIMKIDILYMIIIKISRFRFVIATQILFQ